MGWWFLAEVPLRLRARSSVKRQVMAAAAAAATRHRRRCFTISAEQPLARGEAWKRERILTSPLAACRCTVLAVEAGHGGSASKRQPAKASPCGLAAFRRTPRDRPPRFPTCSQHTANCWWGRAEGGWEMQRRERCANGLLEPLEGVFSCPWQADSQLGRDDAHWSGSSIQTPPPEGSRTASPQGRPHAKRKVSFTEAVLGHDGNTGSAELKVMHALLGSSKRGRLFLILGCSCPLLLQPKLPVAVGF
jgi:hypothetical protein